MEQNIILETSRLILRKLCLDDYQGISKILQDIEVMYAWEHAFSDQEVTDWINENLMRYARDGYSYWAVIEKSSEQLVGVCGIIAESTDNEDHVGIGYIFNKAFWHQGLAFESANACKNYAFRTLKISELTAQIRPENFSSRNVAEKLGMSVIKQFNRLYRGKQMPHLLYGCSK
ncbi:GNAT family N-acetyltransferase [Sporomusa sp. KB1]|jgi:RimJ/RimL family protein N-acetyltransferase|uniref:GNAT family N-acetyltransferase n=1 Tax=Sporomusa sp. KB1 TaxID=943346 RepID=UPI0011A9FC9A|nr:GNAT family N-acetyltransferase [Sporomusa sp. KB1]TWH49443.1 RimJ/RimL family protein N-acetyltransferase [Sporomusa sp. KB1]